MKIKIPLSLKQINGTEAYYEKEAPALCDYLLHDFFSFPQDIPDLTITISTESMEDSYEVRMSESGNSLQIHYNSQWNYTTMFYRAKQHVRTLCKDWDVETLFVSLEY